MQPYTCSQFLDFLELAKKSTFLDQKLISALYETADGHELSKKNDIPTDSESIRGARSEERPRGKVGVSGTTKPIIQWTHTITPISESAILK
jgi:hypothetical protein